MTTHTMPNNILVGSEKLFRTKAPWRINNSLLGQLSKDHNLLLFNIDNNKKPYNKYLSKLSRKLYSLCQREHSHLTFIGIGDECKVLADLYTKFKFKFDTAILINNTHSTSIFNQVQGHCAIYNYTTKNMGFQNHMYGAEVNEHVRSYLPAHMSTRLALEITGNLIYDRYQQNFLEENYSNIIYV